MKPGSRGFDWRKSPAHLAFLGTFYAPRPLDKHPTDTRWDLVLGELPEKAIERFLQEKMLASCSVTEILEHELHKLSSTKLKELLHDHHLPTSGNIDELIQRLIQQHDPTLLFDVPERYLLKCSEQGRELFSRFYEKGIESLEKADHHTLEAVKDVLIWLVKEGIVLGVVGGAAYDLIKKLFPSEEILPQPTVSPTASPTVTPKPAPIPGPPVSTPSPAPITMPTPEKVPLRELDRRPARRTLGYIEPKMVRVQAGHFWMGSDARDPDAEEDEKPRHRLYLEEFWVGRCPVTVAQFAAFVKSSGYITIAEKQSGRWTWRHPYDPDSDVRDKGDHPVTRVSWSDALEFCLWLSDVTGTRYMLPSEAEWEKAARGTDGRIYPWGNVWDKSLCNSNEGSKGDTTPVGYYSSRGGDSPYGCADMAGNVWEWTRSLYKPYPYNAKDGREELASEGSRAMRGGSFNWYRRRALRLPLQALL